MADINILDMIGDTRRILGKKKDWRKILFTEWEMTPLQESFFTNLCEKDENFAKMVMNDSTEDFKKYFEYQIGRGANVNLILVGEQGSGKSTFAASCILFYKSTYTELKKMDVGDPWLTFTTAETLDAYSKIKNNRIIFQDEDDDLQGPGSRNLIEKLGNIIKRVRAWGISLIICCPVLTAIPGCDYAILPFGFERDGAEKYRKTGDPSDCYARGILYVKSKMQRDKYEPQGCVHFSVGKAIKYMDSIGYNEKKRKSFEMIRSNNGGSGAYTKATVKKLKEDARKLLKVALKKGWDGQSKRKLETYLLDTNLSLSTDELKHVKEITYDLFLQRKKKEEKKKELKKQEQEEHLSNMEKFEFNIDEILAEIKSNSKSEKIERDIDIYKASLDPLRSGEEMVAKYAISATRVKQIKDKISGAVNEKLGHQYELFLKSKLEKLYDKVEMLSGVGEPDIICYKNKKIIIYSVKCLSFARKSFSLPYAESKPEIIRAHKLIKEGHNVKVIEHVFNLFNKQIYEEFINQNTIDSCESYISFKNKTFKIHLDKPNNVSFSDELKNFI